ncbi:MAG: oxygen-independent coproporphyrinogen III oxidase [Thiothrix sp.]|nr:MAG: oxygen-independent coproporphyrinogen III oxidase [Thiothrix sp.]
MFEQVQFDVDLIRRYDRSGPRYTSYPTAVSFTDDFTEESYRAAVQRSNEDPIPKPLSLYFHIPFCDTICFYCACNKIATKDYSLAEGYLQRLYQEIEMQSALYDHDRVVEQLHWGGGTPTFLNHAEMAELMQVTRQYFNLRDDDKGDYSIEIDPRSVTRETIRHLRQLGFNRFSLGVQDIDPKVQAAVNRIQSIELNREVIEACREEGAHSVNVDLIYGLPLQSIDSFNRTLDTVIDLSPDRLSVFNYAHLPTRFKPQRRINEADLPSASDKLVILQNTIQKLTDAGYVYVGMDHFAKPDDELVKAQQTGGLHRNFQGYTTHGECDLVGMGVSSIGKVCDVYNQNAKDLESYYKGIDAGHLPIIRGLTLGFDDRLRREVIQRLICDFKLDFKAIERGYRISFKPYFSQELEQFEPMKQDGLIAMDADSIRILPAGRLLVRNVCMVFDASLRKQAGEQRFSRVI